MQDYNPFDKPLRTLEVEDLYKLSAPEGNYIEYKRDMISQKDIAKSIASFANTHGGLLFLGIEEDGQSNRPSDLFTLKSGDPASYKEKVRSAVLENISPVPDFATYTYETELADGDQGYILIISVPESKDTPHISNNGCVYRRDGEGSDPYEAINDPGIFDELYNRRESWKEEANKFCERDVGVTNYQAGTTNEMGNGQPFLEIFTIPTTLGKPVCTDLISEMDKFKETIEESELPIHLGNEESNDSTITLSIEIEFDSIRSTSDGLVAHSGYTEVDGEINRLHTPLSISFFTDGSSKMFVPLPLVESLEEMPVVRDMIQQSLKSNLDEFTYINGNKTVETLQIILNSYFELLKEFNWPAESSRLYFKGRIVNCFRTITVLDQDWYTDLVYNYGPPICYDDTIETPRYSPFQHEVEVGEKDRYTNVFLIMHDIFLALGVHSDNFVEMMYEYNMGLFDRN